MDTSKQENELLLDSLEEEQMTEETAEEDPAMEEDVTVTVESSAPVEIVGVRFKPSGKIYYFDPSGLQTEVGGHVIVETARGIEYGFVAIANKTVPAKDIVLPLRRVVRLATEADEAHYLANKEKEAEAFDVCNDKIYDHRLDMKLVDVEYTFDNSKLLFYFTADGRIDFRELVKDLASVFRTRIELRQIGIRDEAKMKGGIGVCGRPFCCCSFLGDFIQVSIKMAKEQNLSLNSAKISGACGRLMCCLRYESDVYEEEIKKTPGIDSLVDTPDGEGVVVETNPLAGIVRVRLNGAPDQAPKPFVRDQVTFKGYVGKKGNRQKEVKREETSDEELKKLENE